VTVLDNIQLRWQQTALLLHERDRRLFAAAGTLVYGNCGVSAATSLARCTINRGIRDVCANRNEVVKRVRRADP
jgi:hypothetical protein